MKDHVFIPIALVLSIFTSAVLHLGHVDAVQILVIVFLENIFLLLLHVLAAARGEDPYLGKATKDIRRFRDAVPRVKSILENTVAALAASNSTIKKKGLEFLNDVDSSLARLSVGEIEIDLRPGGAFFRELHAGEYARRTLDATTCADPATYWTGVGADDLLSRSKRAVEAGVSVTRLFIHPAATLPLLRPAIEANRAVGVNVLFVDSDAVDRRLVHDFAVCDDGELGVELILDDERRPERVIFYFPGPATANINKLRQNWAALMSHAKSAPELLSEVTASNIKARRA